MTSVAQPNAVLATAEHVGRSCPYCRFPFKEGVHALECGSCRALHHVECWQDNRGCAVMGCLSAPGADVPAPGAPPLPAGIAPPPPPSTGFTAPLPPSGGPLTVGAGGRSPSAEEVVGQLTTWLRRPEAMAIGSAALYALGVMAVVGFVTAIITPSNSYIGIYGGGSLFKEIMRDIVATTLARFGPTGVVLLPVLFVLAPVLGSALGAARNTPRTAGLPTRARLLIAAATGVPLALMVLIVSLFGREQGTGFTAPSVIFFCLLWGGLGGLLGAVRVIGLPAASAELDRLPPTVVRWLRLAGTALKPLVALLLVMGVLGTLVWELQTVRGQGDILGRAKVTAILESPFLAGEYAINDVGLGTFSRFHSPEEGLGVLPLPPDDDSSPFIARYRVFAFKDAWPIALFVPLVILLIAMPLAFATFAGYATASAAGAGTPLLGAGYGALVGIAWAIAMTVLRALAGSTSIVGDSLFVSVLLVGAVAGAAGGLLASLRAPASA